jgi:uncharacterized heparinase superfamily protein
MPASIAKLKKLRGRGLPELRERGRQELLKLTERLLRSSSREMSDRALMRAIDPSLRSNSATATSTMIAGRIRAAGATVAPPSTQQSQSPIGFFPSAVERPEFIEVVNERFGDGRDRIIERAERAMVGRFDVLGHHDLSFGDPIDWRLEPISGKRTGLEHWDRIDYLDAAVAGDKKITWELNRHAHLVTLGQAYWLTGDERFARAFVDQVNAWIEANPPRRGINWSSSLEVSLRAIAWLWALHLMVNSEAVTPAFLTRMLKSLVVHGRHISAYLSHYFSPNTHLTGEALGLVYLGTALPELSHSRRWRLKGLSILFEQLARHIGPDGVYFEQTTYYHRYTVDFYIHLLLLARSSRLVIPSEIEERLTSALDHLMWITRPDGLSPLIGDDDGGRLIALGERSLADFRDSLAVGATIFGRGDWKHVAGPAPIEIMWLLGVDGLRKYDQTESIQPADRSHAFNESGYFVMRDGWSSDSSYALVDCGPHGGAGFAHAHADALSFEFAARGKSWIVDPGTYTYTGDIGMRNWFRSTEAHNTVTVDGQSQSVPGAPFNWETVANATAHEFFDDSGCCYFEGSHDGYSRLSDPVTHVRSLLFVRSDGASTLSPYVVVRDTLDAAGHHRYSTRFQLAADCVATNCRNTVMAAAGNGEKLAIFCWTDSDHMVSLRDAWTSSAYGERSSAAAILIESEGEGPQQLVTLLLPQSKSAGLPSVTQARGVYSISTADSFDLIACPVGAEARSALLAARGQIAWARFTRGRLSRGCLIRGSRLEIMNGLSLRSATPIPWLAFTVAEGQLRIRTRGANQIELTVDETIRSIRLNESHFDLESGRTRLSLTLAETGWSIRQKG